MTLRVCLFIYQISKDNNQFYYTAFCSPLVRVCYRAEKAIFLPSYSFKWPVNTYSNHQFGLLDNHGSVYQLTFLIS